MKKRLSMACLLPCIGLSPLAQAALEEVVVTAQKRAQNLQEVSTAVTAFSTDRLADAGVTNVEGLQYYAPSVTIGNTFGYANLFMRGLGLNTVFGNVDPSVTMYVDGAVISQPGAQLFSFFDLERVEVLRGPQGTLYGRNATGGTINLISQKPSAELSGYARVTLGDYNQLDTEGAVGGTIAGNVLGRIAFQSLNRDGYGKNEVTGNDINDMNRKAIRGQLLFPLSDSVEVLLAAEYGREKDNSGAFQFKDELFPGSTKPAAIADGIGGYAHGKRNYASDVDPENDRTTTSITATVDWQINDEWALKNILNYRDTDLYNFQDLDVSAIVNSTIQEIVFNSEQFSEELQLSYTSSRLRGIGGFYYFEEDLHVENRIDAKKRGGSFIGPDGSAEKRVNFIGDGKTESWALYWNLAFDLTDQITLKAGGRYTEDKRHIINDNVIWAGPNRLSPYFEADDSFEDYTSEAGIEWRPTDTMMLYYTYSEGFKAGTGQLGANSAEIIKPETITNHEVGLKSTWLNNSLMLNVAAYIYEVEDIQLDRTLVGGPAGFTTVFENATNQDAEGVEIEAMWVATDRLRLSGTLAYLKTEFGSFLTFDPSDEANVAPGVPQPTDIKGNSARQAPEWAWNLHGEYDIPLQNQGMLTLIADVSFKDDHYFSEFNNERLSQEHYTLVDVRIKYTSPSQAWTAEIWGKNLGNETVDAGNYAVSSSRVLARTLLPPRTAGVTVNYSF